MPTRRFLLSTAHALALVPPAKALLYKSAEWIHLVNPVW
jgi:hypothetical protein